MNDTTTSPNGQPQNGLYGRIPVELLPTLRELSNLECKVFLFLCGLANFKREPVGEVCMTKSELARQIGISRMSLRRSIMILVDRRLVSLGYGGCIMVCHYLYHHDTEGVSPRYANQPKPLINATTSSPPISTEDHKYISTSENAQKPARKKTKKRARKKPDSWLYWDEGQERLRTKEGRTEDENRFMSRWKGRVDESHISTEIDKANLWLAEGERWRDYKNLAQFFNGWLVRNMT